MRVLALALLFSLSAPAFALNGNTEQTEAGAKPGKPKKICRTEEAPSNSRMPKRVCRTAAEWEQAQESRNDLSDLQRHGTR